MEIREIFSSIQGEGIYIGKRQIFVRFAKCNLDCNYCDTPHKTEPKFCIVSGKKKELKTIDDIAKEIKNLYTKDVFSISLTGGEPLLYTHLIRQIYKKINIPLYLETNSTLPEKAKEIKDLITYSACDIKLNYPKFYNDTLRTIEILRDTSKIFIKIVVTKDINEKIIKKVAKDIERIDDLPLVFQPQTGIKWDKIYKNNLLKFSEVSCNYLSDVRIIPQIHKFLGFK